MKRILFITNIPSPYRVDFFNCLGKTMDVTVLCSDSEKNHRGRDTAWFGRGQCNFQLVQLSRAVFTHGEDSLCVDVIPWLKKAYDHIVVCGYSSPTAMLAMAYLRLKKIPFWMEVDGGLIRPDSKIKYMIKKLLVSAPTYWISSGAYSTRYLVHYGAKPEHVEEYPFTSLWEREILKTIPTPEEKQALRRKLDLEENKLVLYVGRFDPEKGMDDLLKASSNLDKSIGVYFIGGEPTQEHLAFCQEKGLSNVHFRGFQKKDALLEYYKAADLLVLPTFSDVWGLVINEAMACGLPVITTDRCVAGIELIRDGVNGYLVPVGDREALAERIHQVFRGDPAQMGAAALETIRPYTIENMARRHAEIFTEQEI